MNQKIWGPFAWQTLHTVFAATDKQEEALKLHYKTCTILPCSVCRDNCQNYIAENPLENKSLACYWFKMHNHVSLTHAQNGMNMSYPDWLKICYKFDDSFWVQFRCFALFLAVDVDKRISGIQQMDVIEWIDLVSQCAAYNTFLPNKQETMVDAVVRHFQNKVSTPPDVELFLAKLGMVRNYKLTKLQLQ